MDQGEAYLRDRQFAFAIMLLTSKRDENKVHHPTHTVNCRGGQSQALKWRLTLNIFIIYFLGDHCI